MLEGAGQMHGAWDTERWNAKPKTRAALPAPPKITGVGGEGCQKASVAG